ncbi:MAG: EI24 domain-containing protein [Cyanobacteria bacterium]|nr:EI24 domain-containing protein [Cyanobacteriota bacterium]MDW8201571.1 EI24 domain-containing protein [Cyanobacteriota bacterium SKYGB_h_bin112]
MSDSLKSAPGQAVIGSEPLGGVLAGVTYPLRLLRLFIQQPRLLSYIIVPVVLNILVGVGLYIGILLPGWQGIDRLIANLPTWAAFLDWVLRILLAGGLLLLLGFLLAQFGTLLGAPWYGQLAEQLEQWRLGSLLPAEPFSVRSVIRDVGRAILYEVKKLVVSLGVGGLLLVVGLVIPGVGPAIATIGGITLSALIICMDFFDAPLERRRWTFRAKLGTVFRTMPASISFGLVSLGLVSIPLLNFVTVPLCVAAGTLLVCDRVLACQMSASNHPTTPQAQDPS